MCEWPASETKVAPGISRAARLCFFVHLVRPAGADQTPHLSLPEMVLEIGPSAATDCHAASSAAGPFCSRDPCPVRFREATVQGRTRRLHERRDAASSGGGDRGGDCPGGRGVEVPCVGPVAAQDERQETFGRVLTERVAQLRPTRTQGNARGRPSPRRGPPLRLSLAGQGAGSRQPWAVVRP